MITARFVVISDADVKGHNQSLQEAIAEATSRVVDHPDSGFYVAELKFRAAVRDDGIIKAFEVS